MESVEGILAASAVTVILGIIGFGLRNMITRNQKAVDEKNKSRDNIIEKNTEDINTLKQDQALNNERDKERSRQLAEVQAFGAKSRDRFENLLEKQTEEMKHGFESINGAIMELKTEVAHLKGRNGK